MSRADYEYEKARDDRDWDNHCMANGDYLSDSLESLEQFGQVKNKDDMIAWMKSEGLTPRTISRDESRFGWSFVIGRHEMYLERPELEGFESTICESEWV